MNRPDISLEKEQSRLGANTLLLLTLLITAITLGRTAVHEFVDLDDRFLLADNPKLNPPTWRSVLGYVLPRNVDENLYIPATQLVWGLLAEIGHTEHADASGSLLNPWVFHTANLCLHLASIALAFAILRCFFTDWPAWMGAMIFAIHPVQVETVAWASGLRDLLAALFGLLCLHQLIRFRQTKRRVRWVVATVMLALAMLAKPSAVALPLSALVVDVLLLRTRFRQSLGYLWVWFVLGVPIVLVTRHVQPMVWPINSPLIARPIIAMDAVAFYITKIAVPIHLVFDYGRTPPSVMAGGWRAIWALPVVLCAFLIWRGRRDPQLTAGCLLAISGIVPVLGLVSFAAQDYSTVSDHYLYPSMLGVAVIVAFVIQAAVERIGGPLAYGTALAIMTVLAMQSFAMTAVWNNSASLFTYALGVNPRSSIANAGLGFSQAASGDLPGAAEHLQLAEQLNPHNGMAIMGLANVLMSQGDLDGAATQYEMLMQVYQMQPNFDPKLGASAEIVIAARLIRRGDNAGAIAALKQARRWDPLNPRIGEMIAHATTRAPSTTDAHAAP